MRVESAIERLLAAHPLVARVEIHVCKDGDRYGAEVYVEQDSDDLQARLAWVAVYAPTPAEALSQALEEALAVVNSLPNTEQAL